MRWILPLTVALLGFGCTDDPAPSLVDGQSNNATNNGTDNHGGPNNGGPNNGANNGPNNGGPNNVTPWDPGPGWVATNFDGGYAPPPANAAIVPQSYDVVIFGAGTGGSAAAIQAGRMGVNVALVEETDWVGGQATAGGVSTMDEGGFNNDAGIYGEFIARAESHYAAKGKRARRCGIRAIPCTEPKVGQQILRAMLSEAGVTIIERTRPVAGRVDNGVLTKVRGYQKSQNRILELGAHVFIDATEYGDVLPLAQVQYRSGNTTSDNLDLGACVQDITVPPIMRYYDSVPADLKFQNPPPGYDFAVEQKFKAIVVGQGGVDWEAEGWGAGYPTDWKTHVSYRATPDSARPGDSVIGDFDTITRTGINWANDFGYTAGDYETRRFDANCEAKLHTLQFLYYVQNVMGVQNWAIANDEGYDSPWNVEENDCPNIPAEFDSIERHMNPIPYIREARRMVGVYTLKGSDIQRAGGGQPAQKRWRSSIAVGDYAMDLHNCNAAGDLESGIETMADYPQGFIGGPFQIPMEVLIPERVDGFLAAEKNISQSRLVNGATRLQPSTMATGQAAGALAALAVQRNQQPRQVSPILVQDALVEAGARIGMGKFSDVPLGAARWEDIEFASGVGVLIGNTDGTFGAGQPLSRAHAAVYLARLFELDTSNPPNSASFSDVPTNHWAFGEIEAVKTAGITSGCGDGSMFCVNDNVSRAQMATFLARGLGFSGSAPQGPTFDDVPPGNVHYANIEWLYSKGLVLGCTNASYCPDDPLTRDQGAVLARRVLVWDVDN